MLMSRNMRIDNDYPTYSDLKGLELKTLKFLFTDRSIFILLPN